MSNDTPLKTCRKCGNEYPATKEHFRITQKGSLTSPCKKCIAEAKKDWRHQNPEKVAAEKKRSHERNREHDLARSKRWYDANRDYIRNEYWPEYYAEHKDEYIKRSADWYAENKEYVSERDKEKYYSDIEAARAKRRKYKPRDIVRAKATRKKQRATRRARKAEAPGTFTDEDVLLQYRSQKGLCWWCSCELGDNYHVDHLVPLARGGTNWPNNIVCSCPTCNWSRQDKLPHEWNGKLF